MLGEEQRTGTRVCTWLGGGLKYVGAPVKELGEEGGGRGG